MTDAELQDNVLELLDKEPIFIHSDFGEIEPINDFESLDLPPELTESLHRLRIYKPTKLQKHVFAHMINSERDLKVHALNGSGKTLAYLLPIVHDCIQNSSCVESAPSAVIVTCSHFLATQINNFLKLLLGELTTVKHILTIGDHKFNQAVLREGCDILVCTLGRFAYHVKEGEIRLDRLKILVVDDADSTLDLSSETSPKPLSDLVRDLRFSGANFRCVLLSSTYELTHKYTTFLRPTMFTQINFGIKNGPLPFVKQNFVFVEQECTKMQQFTMLVPHFLKIGQLIVFAKQDSVAHQLFARLSQQGKFGSLIYPRHLDNERDLQWAIDGTAEFVVSTALCSRGLNFPHAQMIVNYDMPISEFEYIHRIGRCVHQGAQAQVYTFFSRELDQGKAHIMIKAMTNAGQEPCCTLEEMADEIIYSDKWRCS